MKQSWSSIHFPHQLMCRYQGCIPSWLDCIRQAGKIISVESLFSFPDFQLWLLCVGGCNSYEEHMWGRGGDASGGWQYLAYVREIIIGTNTSVLLCSGTSVSHPGSWPIRSQDWGVQPIRGQETAPGADLSSSLLLWG